MQQAQLSAGQLAFSSGVGHPGYETPSIKVPLETKVQAMQELLATFCSRPRNPQDR